MLAFFLSTDVDSFNICLPSFAKVAMWIIMADFLSENIHIIFALFYYYFFFSVLQPGCIDKFHKDTQSIIEHVAKDSAEKGLSEEAVNLFDLAKVHYCTVCRHSTSDFIQLFRERLSDKVHVKTPKGIVGGFEFTVLQRHLKWPWTAADRLLPWMYVCQC